jgi:hypothetical protein
VTPDNGVDKFLKILFSEFKGGVRASDIEREREGEVFEVESNRVKAGKRGRGSDLGGNRPVFPSWDEELRAAVSEEEKREEGYGEG